MIGRKGRLWDAHPVRGPQYTARLVAVAVVVLGALSLVALAARSDRAATVTPIVTTAPTVGSGPTLLTPSVSVSETEEAGGDPRKSTMPDWIVWLAAGIFVAPIVLLLVFVPAILWIPRFRVRWRRPTVPGVLPDPVDDEVPAARLTAAVDAGLRELDQGPPGEGVLASWVLLERAAADAGTHRAAPDTPSELAGRLLDRHAVSSGPLLRLADLYREARFSRHELTEADRSEARAALEQLRTELQSSPIGGRR